MFFPLDFVARLWGEVVLMVLFSGWDVPKSRGSKAV